MSATASNSGGISPGGIATYTINLAPQNGFAQNVTLSLTGSNAMPGSTGPQPAANLTGLPAAATAEFSAAMIAGGAGSSTLTIATSAKTPPGSYTLVVSGISTDGVRTTWPPRRWLCWARPAT